MIYKGSWDLLRVLALLTASVNLTMLICGAILLAQNGVFHTIWSIIVH